MIGSKVQATNTMLEMKTFDDLRAGLQGELLLPGDAGYDESRTLWNAMIDRRPAAILRPRSVADVVAGVRYARAHDLPLSIKGGGHNVAGLAVADGALTIDNSLMRGVVVDPVRRVVRAEAGNLLGDVDRATQAHGLATVLGLVSQTGIAGLTLGGGFGYLTRRFGWTVDNVLSMEMVTADGRIVRADEQENPDLFWALRGGGGNFGVVTSFEYKLYPVGPEVVGGVIAWRGEDAPQVLEMYRSLIKQAPPELTVLAMLRMAPPAPWLPAEVHGKPIVGLAVLYSGPVEEGEKQVAAIKGLGSPVGDIVQRRAYLSQQTILDATNPRGRRDYWKSETLPGVEPEMLARAVEHAARMVSPHSVILIVPVDGALNRLPEETSAMGNRDAAAIVFINSQWERPEDDRPSIAWARNTWQDMRRFSTGGTYINVQTEDEGADRIRAAYGKNYERLAEIKARWDPANVFHVNKNIIPQP